MTINLPLKNIKNKIRISGNVIETFDYGRGYFLNYPSTNKVGRASQNTTEEDKKCNRKKVLARASSNVRNFINANPQLNKFFTLTFKDNVTDLKYANKQFRCFIKRLNRYLAKIGKSSVEYVAVVEFQKRGAIHYHLLCNLPFISAKTLQEIWGNGFIRINKIDDVDNVGAYVTKYMTKDNEDERLVGNRSYFTSQGLNKPIEIVNTDIENIIQSALLLGDLTTKKEPYNTTFENEYLGTIEYNQIVLDKPFDMSLISDYINKSTPRFLNVSFTSETLPFVSV